MRRTLFDVEMAGLIEAKILSFSGATPQYLPGTNAENGCIIDSRTIRSRLFRIVNKRHRRAVILMQQVVNRESLRLTLDGWRDSGLAPPNARRNAERKQKKRRKSGHLTSEQMRKIPQVNDSVDFCSPDVPDVNARGYGRPYRAGEASSPAAQRWSRSERHRLLMTGTHPTSPMSRCVA